LGVGQVKGPEGTEPSEQRNPGHVIQVEIHEPGPGVTQHGTDPRVPQQVLGITPVARPLAYDDFGGPGPPECLDGGVQNERMGVDHPGPIHLHEIRLQQDPAVADPESGKHGESARHEVGKRLSVGLGGEDCDR
jgi:hypothetical protein